jgi:hypothetical protein
VIQATDPRLPHSPDAERAYLGGIILGGAGSELEDADFFLSFHQALHRSFQRLKREGKPTNDLVLLSEHLSPAELENIGGIPYLSGLVNEVPRVSNLVYYAEIIKGKSAIRRALACCSAITEKLATSHANTREVLREASILSVRLREEVGQNRILNFQTAQALASNPDQAVPWIAKGYVARESITEVGAKVKMGKTTFVLAMVRAILEGQDFLGEPTSRTSVVYLTEQPAVSFREAIERAGILGRPDFISLMFSATRGLDWPQTASAALAECHRTKSKLLVVDTLGQFARLSGDKENNAGDALESMLPVQEAVASGLGVILVRHERKGGGDVGDSGRGSSAFAGAVDIVLSLRKPEGNAGKNRREIRSLSRFSETPNKLVIELSDDGQYVAVGERRETTLKDAREGIFRITPTSELDADDLQAICLRADISRQTGQRAIEALVQTGELSRTGKGTKGNPFRYFRPEIPL